MSVFSVFLEWFSPFTIIDWIAFIFFLSGLMGYRFFLALMLKKRPDNLFLGKLQQYRNAWIDAHSGSKDSIVVVQTMRNTIMTASFLASTSIILIMGALSLLSTVDPSQNMLATSMSGTTAPTKEVFNILMIIIVLSYSFFNFTWHIREINYMSYILNIPKEELDKIEGDDSTPHIANKFLTAGIHFSLGMRGFYFLIPLLMWLFSPVLMFIASVVIFSILIRRDLTG